MADQKLAVGLEVTLEPPELLADLGEGEVGPPRVAKEQITQAIKQFGLPEG